MIINHVLYLLRLSGLQTQMFSAGVSFYEKELYSYFINGTKLNITGKQHGTTQHVV